MAKPAKAANRASGVAVLCGGSVLLAKRSKKCHLTGSPLNLGGYWSIFAGSIDPGETPKEAAARELFEESKIFVDFKHIKFFETIKDSNCEFYVHTYKSDSLLIPELCKEHTQSGWFLIENLDNFTELLDVKLKDCLMRI